MLRSRPWFVLTVLTAVNFVNYVDRQMVYALYPSLQQELFANDPHANFKLGLLGTAMMVVHALMTIPMGYAADRFDRRRVISVGIVGWSMGAALAGVAPGFGVLLVALGAIGVGEAAYGPASNTILCEIYHEKDKARTVAIFNVGMFLGSAGGIALGGILGASIGWRACFLVAAAPGVLLTVAVLVMKIQPIRTGGGGTQHGMAREIWIMTKEMFHIRSLRWALPGGVLISFAAGGFVAWFVTFIVGLPPDIGFHGQSGTASTFVAGIAILGGVCGVVVGGLVADRLQRRGPWGRAVTIAIGFFAATPCAYFTMFPTTRVGFLIAAFFTLFFIPWYNGPMAALIDDVVPPEKAALAQASFMFVMHLLGTAPSSSVVGWLADRVGLPQAMLLPIACAALAGICYAMAARHVGDDMLRARQRRNSGQVPAPVTAAAAPELVG